MNKEHKTHQEFFERIGENWIHPRSYGDCIWPVTIEELYQHFKSRMIEEFKDGAPNGTKPTGS